jgi:hypothetical protein
VSQSRSRGRGKHDDFSEMLFRAMVAEATSGADNPRAARPVPEDPNQSRPLDVNLVRMLEDATRHLDSVVSCIAEVRDKVDSNYPLSVGVRKEELLDRLETADLKTADLLEILSELSTAERRLHSSFSVNLCRTDVSLYREARSRRAAAKLKADMDALAPDEPEDS